jgi:parallel beta-helix repeat protein
MRRNALLLALSAALLGCPTPAVDDDDDSASEPTPDPLPEGCDLLVEPGDDARADLQTAFIEIDAGGTVCLAAGTYDLDTEIALDAANVTIRGAGEALTILDFATQDVGANGIQVTSDGVTLEDFTVLNTPGDGIRVLDVDGITFQRVTVGWDAVASVENGAYGIYPVGCSDVVVTDCTVYGARDAGVYIGQSTDITVSGNEVYGNVAGIEIENSTVAEVFDNHAHDNTAGVLVFNLPDLPVQDGRDTVLRDNVLENNNLDNFAEPGTIVAGVPVGLGIMILAADDTTIRDNTIRGNITTGVLVISYTDLTVGPQDDPDFDPWSEGTCIRENTFATNGTDPQGAFADLIPVVPSPDIVWDGCPDADPTKISLWENIADDDGASIFFDARLPPCGSITDSDDDPAPVTRECGED